jgi:hypothetical protein
MRDRLLRLEEQAPALFTMPATTPSGRRTVKPNWPGRVVGIVSPGDCRSPQGVEAIADSQELMRRAFLLFDRCP